MKVKVMKKLFLFSTAIFRASIVLVLSAQFLMHGSIAGASDTRKEKPGEKLEAVKKEAKKAGEESTRSAKDLSLQAGEELKKAGKALKKAGRELKKSAQEAAQSLKDRLTK